MVRRRKEEGASMARGLDCGFCGKEWVRQAGTFERVQDWTV